MRPLAVKTKSAENYYYKKDPYFNQKEDSMWHGKGAKNLGLDGPVNQYSFRKMIHGILPGTTKQVVKSGPGDRRAGVDLPLSTPKSISIMALHCGDQRLIEAHQKAVKQTIEYIEKRYIHTRKTKNGETKIRHHRKGIFATFNHSFSRENDPHLHTHLLIMNMVKTDKNKYQAFCNDPIFKDQQLITQGYRSFLKRNIEALGYKTRKTQKAFEIEGVRNEWIKVFSKRHEDIADKKEKTSDKIAFLDTRKDKDTSLSYDELKEICERQVPKKDILNSVKNFKGYEPKLKDAYLTVNDKLSICSSLLCEKEAVFDSNHLYVFVMKAFDMDIYEAEKFIKEGIKRKKLVYLGEKEEGKRWPVKLWTTKRMIEVEKHIVTSFEKGKGVVEIPLGMEKINDSLEKNFNWLTKGQKEAVVNVLSSRDRFSIIQGDAGTGKTASMLAVKNIMDGQAKTLARATSKKIKNQTNQKISSKKIEKLFSKTSICGMGFTGKAAIELNIGSGIESTTIHSFLGKRDLFELEGKNIGLNKNEISILKKHINPIWIVDESSMVASKDMSKIANKALEENAKVIFVGDGKQLSSIGAGRMFSDLQKMECVQTVHMEEVMRQKTDYMKKVVGLIKNKDESSLEKAFDVLDRKGLLNDIEKEKDRLDRISSDYVKIKGDVLVLCGDNETKEKLNLKIRSKLKYSDKQGTNFICRNPISLDNERKCFSKNYEVGSKVFIQKSNQLIKAGQDLVIKNIDTKSNTLFLETKTGKIIEIKTLKEGLRGKLAISPFKETKRNLIIGEKIVFTKNDKKLNVQNGLTGKVNYIDSKGNLTINIDGQNRKVSFNQKQYAWIDHGYAVTIHKSQGQTCDKVMLVSSKNKGFMEDVKSLYVATTRAKKGMIIYSDKIDSTRERFKKLREKTSTLEYTMER